MILTADSKAMLVEKLKEVTKKYGININVKKSKILGIMLKKEQIFGNHTNIGQEVRSIDKSNNYDAKR